MEKNMNRESDVETREKILIVEVFKGPSADQPEVNRLCYRAWREGLVLDGKFGFVREVAEIMHHAQPNSQPAKPLEEFDLQLVATRFNRPPDRVRIVAELMAEYGLLTRSGT